VNDNITRCQWSLATQEYRDYRDNEWGFPVTDDVRLFEKICLEGFQSGLSWLTILNKRESFRKAFAGFDYHKVAKFDDTDIQRLLSNEGIIRHRGKIEATINNAKRAIELMEEAGTLAAFFWQYEPANAQEVKPVVATTEESIALSKALKKRGWKFVGPTTAYAFMQAMGLVNDHAANCFVREKATQMRKMLVVPKLLKA
jgi:DNA-3-methyladenine glycosylase I